MRRLVRDMSPSGRHVVARQHVLARRYASDRIIYWTTSAECQAWGFPAPSEIVVHGEPASGDITGKLGGTVYADLVTPHYQQPFDGDQLGVGMDLASLDAFEVASAAAHDYSTGAWCQLGVVMVSSVTSTRSLWGKREPAAPNSGYEITTNSSGAIIATIDGTGGHRTLMVAGPLTQDVPVYIWLGADPAANVTWIETPDGSDSTTFVPVTDSTSLQNFAFGASRLAAAGCVIGHWTEWTGAAAQTMRTAGSALIASWWPH